MQPSRSQGRVTVSSTESFSITASVRGVPEPAISWAHDGVDVAPSSRISMTTTNVGDRTISTLTVTNANDNDAGRYTVQVTGDSGSVSDYVNVAVQCVFSTCSC